MIKKKILTTILFILFFLNKPLIADIEILITVDNEIITNHDLKKEISYLEILNPNLIKLNDDQKLELAKNSLINEIVKKKEIKKYLVIESENEFTDAYLKDLYTRSNFNNELEFKEKLKQKNNYTLSQIREKIDVELFWNELIYLKYKNQINVDEEVLIEKVDSLKGNTKEEFFLSEIVFKKKKDIKLENFIQEINLSIREIGFNNTANIYSISDSAKYGGKLGWISKNSLSKPIYKKLKLINKGDFTDTIMLGNSFLILKIEDVRITESIIDKEKEIKRLIKLETNKQLNSFSKIYFDKSKINYSINEK